MEKCFSHACRSDRNMLISEVLGMDDRHCPLVAMVKDQYANYVIQKMVDILDLEQRNLFIQRIKRHVPSLRRISYGKHIIAKIEKITGKSL